MPTSIGQLLVNEILPPKYQDTSRTLGANELEDLLAKIAKEDPSVYKDVSARLMRLGNRGAYESGTTLRLSDILPTFDKSVVLKGLNRQEDAIRANKRLTDEQKSALINDLYDKANDLIKQQTYETAVAIRNPFAMQVKSKARGNQDQLAAMISTPGIYTDPRGKIVPLFIQHSFAEGLTPAEYWAGSFGARLGVVSTKMSTAKGGYLGKLFSMASMDEVVTEPDCGGAYGMPVKAEDKDNIGCVLQQDIGGHEAGEVITKDTLSDFARKNIDEIIVRSPVTCACKNGVCSKCCGIRETGGFPPVGYNLGLNAASAISERITHGALNQKHSGKKANGKSQFSGFEAIKNMATVPGTYPDAAVVATEDGTITKIEKAPQGGSYVYVNDTKLYVAPNYDLEVKEGDEVEAGDQISDGVINPVDVVNYKGIGEGRRYFTNRFTQMMKDSNYKVNRRNVEALARSLVNHVRVEAEDAEGQLLPGDVSTYSQWSFGYKPRTNSVMQAPKKAVGQYLEQPVLHYTIGTKISKKTAADMAKYGIDQIYTNPNPVDVTPMMQSIVKSTGSSNDWMARLGTTYLKTRLTEDAQRGAESNLHGTNPLPGVAKGVEFGNYFDPGVHRPGGYTY